MTKFKLDEDARSKLREIVEKRAHDQKEVLVQIEKHLETSTNASSMLCKIARPLIDGEPLADPPDRPAHARHPGSGGGGGHLCPRAGPDLATTGTGAGTEVTEVTVLT